MGLMALTGLVKDELSRVSVVKPCCRKAEVSTLLRFAGGLHLAAGRIVVEAELDTGAVARRVHKDGASLARQTGLVDSNGRPVRGLPRQVVSGTTCDCEAAWRGAFLAHG